MEIKTYCNGMGPFKYEAIEMTRKQFDTIKGEEDTPSFVAVEGHVYYNEYTCRSGYAGTCRCLSHPKKLWREYHAKEMRWGKIVYSK